MGTQKVQKAKKAQKKKKYQFKPFIGKDFDEQTDKLLIVGPRHYCDGIYDTRNLIPSFVNVVKDIKKSCIEFELQELNLTEEILKVIEDSFRLKKGCNKLSPKDCLRKSYIDKEFVCPVIKDLKCPRSNNCEFKDDVKCGGNRHLACETLLAIYDYTHAKEEEKKEKKTLVPLDDLYEIPSANHGHYLFNSITDYLKKQFSMNDPVWDKIAFMNIIQRFVNFRGTSDEYINNNITRSDIDITVEFIKQNGRRPFTYVVATMNCIAKELSTDEWFNKIYKRDSNHCYKDYICFKYNDKPDGFDKLNDLNHTLVIQSLKEICIKNEKNSSYKTICIFLYYGLDSIMNKYKNNIIKWADVRNILLDHIVCWMQRKIVIDEQKIADLLNDLEKNASFDTYAFKYEKDSCLKIKSRKGDGKVKESRRNSYREDDVETYGKKFQEDYPDFHLDFFKAR